MVSGSTEQPNRRAGTELGIGLEELPMSLLRAAILIVKFLRLVNHHGIDVVRRMALLKTGVRS